jgi:phasin family protein
MARKPHSDRSIFEMFSKLGQDLQMPGVDVDAILAHHRKNLEALEKSARATAEGASSVMHKQREMLQETLAEITDMAKHLRSTGTPQEAMSRQAEFARKSFEAALKNASDVAEMVRKSSTDSFEILRARIREGADEIREGYEKRK